MKSHMVHQFSQIPQANISRSRFSRPSSYKTTFDAGWIVPFFLDSALPSDTFTLKSNFLIRFASPLIAPIMDNLYCDVFYFAVPYRLLWSNWERFCGERVSPDDVYNGQIPKVVIDGSSSDVVQSLPDYFGIPVSQLAGKGSYKVNALPFRAYNLIYQTWFKDENLIAAPELYTGDADKSFSLYPLRRRGKRHDYFTSCLPWPQKGPESIIAIGGQAPVYGNGSALGLTYLDNSSSGASQHFATLQAVGNSSAVASSTIQMHTATLGSNPVGSVPSGTSRTIKVNGSVGVTPNKSNSGLLADLSAVNPIPINDFRRAVALQHWYEALARGGSRYREICRAVFGAVSPDARLQIPEYLGGGSFPIDFKTVEQTSGTSIDPSETPQGNLAAFGLGADTIGFTKSFTEHCLVLGLLSIRADLTYQQGLDRFWSQSTLEDLYWPQFAHLGEQVVRNREIYADNTSDDDGVFGYQERYAEYRYKPSRITGKLNSAYPQPLDAWHLAQFFGNRPVLNESFINDNPPIDRVVAVPDEPQFIMDSYHDLVCARPMPLYGVPGLNRF